MEVTSFQQSGVRDNLLQLGGFFLALELWMKDERSSALRDSLMIMAFPLAAQASKYFPSQSQW